MPKFNESKLVKLLQTVDSSRTLVGEELAVAEDGFQELPTVWLEEEDLIGIFFLRKVLKAQKLKFWKLETLKMKSLKKLGWRKLESTKIIKLEWRLKRLRVLHRRFDS